MKAIKIIGMSLMTLALTGTVSAQRGETSTTVVNAAEQEYFTDVKTLTTFFTDGTIPASFPKYDSNLNKEANKKAVATWAKKPENYALLSETGKAKLEGFDAKQAKKNTKK